MPDIWFHMDQRQLKTMIEAGEYRPQPSLVAEAMLRRRGVRELLVGEARLIPAGQSQPPSALGRWAA